MKNHTTLHLEDFLMDDSFRQFVAGESRDAIDKWHLWIKENSHAKKEFETAITVMNILLKTKKNIPNLKTEEDLADLLASIEKEKNLIEDKAFSTFNFWRIAAITLFFLSVSAFIYFKVLKTKTPEIVAYNEIIVPLGEKSQVILADGTHIWINSSSKLKYPVNFNKEERTVYLEGEAFFDVKRDETQPFVVNTPDLKVKVLGTAFNVKNYPGDKKAVTTVLRGLVSVETTKEKAVFLKPNENYTLFTGNTSNDVVSKEMPEPAKTKDISLPLKPIVTTKVNAEAATSWKDQTLVFSDETFEDVAIKMERWYNVKIYIKGEDLKKERYRGKFVNNETIYQVLEAIKYTTKIKYRVKNNEFYIEKP